MGNYIQPLWEAIRPAHEAETVGCLLPLDTPSQCELNGGVEAATTLAGAALALLLR